MTSTWSGRMRRLTRAFVYGATAALAVGAIGFLVRTKYDPLIRLDESIIASATDFTRAHPTWRSFLIGWQEATQPKLLYLLALPVVIWAWRAKHLKTRALWAAITMLIGWNLQFDIKLLVERARPVVAEPISHAPGFSFPSGHATNAAVWSATLLLLVWPLLSHTWRVALSVAVAAFVLMTCLDRVFLGVHFPSDVTAGVLLGGGVVLASYAGYLGWRPPTPATLHPTQEN